MVVYPNNYLHQSRKICVFQKVLKTTTSTTHPSLRDPAKSKVFSRRKSHLLFAIEFAYPADRVTKRSVYRSPLKVISYSPGLGVSEQLSEITGYVQFHKTAYTDFKSLSDPSTSNQGHPTRI